MGIDIFIVSVLVARCDVTGNPDLIDGDSATCPTVQAPNTFYPEKVVVTVNTSNLCLQGNTLKIAVTMKGKAKFCHFTQTSKLFTDNQKAGLST